MAKAKKDEREVKFPEPVSMICRGDDALTVEQAKDLLGWEETDDKEKALLTDRDGKRIYCANNVNNRPLNMPNVESIVQEVLNRRWKFNGENIIVGRTGLVLNGQHTLIGLILAEQDRLAGTCKGTGKKWTAIHPNPLSIEKSIMYGVDESDDVVNTLDTNRPRTLADVIFRSQYFQDFTISAEGGNRKLTKGERTQIARMCEHAIRLVWSRTGVENAFGLKRTHAESLAFLDRHKRIVDCVKHVYTDNTEGKIGDLISPGYASGLMYLFAASASDGAKYYKADPRSEKKMDFSRMDKAETFITFIASNDPLLKAVREARAMLKNEAEKTDGSLTEKMEILLKAWNLFAADLSITPGKLNLQYETNAAGVSKLIHPTIVGGIDAGQPEEEPEEEDDPAEIEAAKETVKKEAVAKKADPKPPVAPPAPKKTARQLIDEKREAEAKVLDAAKDAPKFDSSKIETTDGTKPTPMPAPTPAASANGFKPTPKPKPRPIPVPALRGGV